MLPDFSCHLLQPSVALALFTSLVSFDVLPSPSLIAATARFFEEIYNQFPKGPKDPTIRYPVLG